MDGISTDMTAPAPESLIRKFIREFTLPSECAYARGHYGDIKYVISEDVPGDSGGLTKWGIDQASHPEVDIENLTADQAIDIYEQEFAAIKWLDGTQCVEFPLRTALAFFDCREVCGLRTAWRCLQGALWIEADGEPGLQTKAAFNAKAGHFFDFSDDDLASGIGLSTMLQQRRIYHRALAANVGHDEQFLQGWLNRCDNLEKYLKTLA